MSDSQNSRAVPEDDLKRTLVRRVVLAGVMIAALLAVLAFIDYLGRPAEETPIASGPTFNAPVPVARKDVSQQVKPADLTPPPATLPTATPAEGTAAGGLPPPPPPAAAPAPAVAAPSSASEPPPKPEVAAQPSLPAASSKPATAARPSRTAEPSTPAEGTSSQFAGELPKMAPAVETKPPARESVSPSTAPSTPPPAPPRLFSGYAVQAGVFADAQHAEELRARLTLNGIPSTMEARVQVGPFKTREEAEAARQKLKAMGIDGLLLPPKGGKR